MPAPGKQQAPLGQLGLPKGWKAWSTAPFGSLNQQDSRPFLQDSELYWRENYIRIGNANMRTLWDLGAPLWTIPQGVSASILCFASFNIGPNHYFIIFLTDGTAVQVSVDTAVWKWISQTAGTFYAGIPDSRLPGVCQYGDQYLLICNNFASNNYWIWDSTNLFQAGTLSPQISILSGGANYTSPPSATVLGGSGGGAVLTAALVNGSISQITVTNPGSGYVIGDNPIVQISGGGHRNPTFSVDVRNGSVTSIDITDGGSGFTGIPQINLSAPPSGGYQAFAEVISVANGVITGIQVTYPGSGYTNPPTVTATGGGGSGLTATANLSDGVIVGISVIDGGTGYTSAPDLIIVGSGSGAAGTATFSNGSITGVMMTSFGSGYISNQVGVIAVGGGSNVAAAEISIMPFGISGTSIETFTSRIWIDSPFQLGATVQGGVFLVGATESVTDFAISDGGVLFQSTERFLRERYTALRQSNGYLYQFGDSCVDVISNVNTTGNPPATSFNYQNTDPQIGTGWRDSIQDFSRTSLFANPLGIFGLYGGAVTKVSGKVDMIFNAAILPPASGAVVPSSAVADIFNRKTYMLLMTILDPFTGLPRNVMVAWDETDWFIISQTRSLTYIGTQEINTALTAWGTDGTSLYPLLQTPSRDLTKTLATKLYGGETPFVIKQMLAFYVQAQDNSGQRISAVAAGTTVGVYSALSFDVTVDAAGLADQSPLYQSVRSGSYSASSPVAFTSPYPNWSVYGLRLEDVTGINIGVTMTSTEPDFTLANIAIGYQEIAPVFA